MRVTDVAGEADAQHEGGSCACTENSLTMPSAVCDWFLHCVQDVQRADLGGHRQRGAPRGTRTSQVKLMRSVKKVALRLIETFVDKAEDTADHRAAVRAGHDGPHPG